MCMHVWECVWVWRWVHTSVCLEIRGQSQVSPSGMLCLRQSLSLAQGSPVRPDWLASPGILTMLHYTGLLHEFWNSDSGPDDYEPGISPLSSLSNPGFVFVSRTGQCSVAFNGMSCSKGTGSWGCLHIKRAGKSRSNRMQIGWVKVTFFWDKDESQNTGEITGWLPSGYWP